MGSKLGINRQKSSETVRSAGTNYVEKMAARTGDLLRPEAGAAVRTLVQAAVTRLGETTEYMVAADDQHLNEIADDSQTLATRDEAVAATRASLMEVREICGTVFGADYVHQLGFDGNTPTDAVQLERLATQVPGNLDKVQRPSPRGLG